MKKFIFTLGVIFTIMSCSKDCDKERKDIEDRYNKALYNTGGSPAAIDELKRQRDEAISKLDC